MSLEEGTITLTWKIENYPLCYLKSEECLESPVFTAITLSGSKWFIRLFPKNEVIIDQDYLSCFLVRSNDTCTEEISIVFSFNIACSDKTILYCKKFNKTKFMKRKSLGWPKIIKNDDILHKMKNLQDKTLIICYHLSSQMEKSDSCEYVAKTRIGEKKSLLKWNMPFSKWKDFSERKKVSFQEASHYEVTISATNGDFSAEIEKTIDKSAVTRAIQLKVSLLDINGTEVTSIKDTHRFDSGANSDVWEFSLLNIMEYLKKSDNNCVRNGIFSLLWDFSASNGIELESIEYFKCETFSNVDTLLSLRNDLHKIFLKDDFSDVILKLKGKTFHAHRSILSARSPVFYAMFTGDMLEQKTGVIEISDVEEKILQSFLKFIYTGTVDAMDYDSATKLLIVADKYNVQSLIKKCACFLISDLSVENAAEVFSISDMLNHKFLKAATLEFIASHRKEVVHTPKWAEFIKENVQLLNEIIEHFVQG